MVSDDLVAYVNAYPGFVPMHRVNLHGRRRLNTHRYTSDRVGWTVRRRNARRQISRRVAQGRSVLPSTKEDAPARNKASTSTCILTRSTRWCESSDRMVVWILVIPPQPRNGERDRVTVWVILHRDKHNGFQLWRALGNFTRFKSNFPTFSLRCIHGRVILPVCVFLFDMWGLC